jgi:hypothetical protein
VGSEVAEAVASAAQVIVVNALIHAWALDAEYFAGAEQVTWVAVQFCASIWVMQSWTDE